MGVHCCEVGGDGDGSGISGGGVVVVVVMLSAVVGDLPRGWCRHAKEPRFPPDIALLQIISDTDIQSTGVKGPSPSAMNGYTIHSTFSIQDRRIPAPRRPPHQTPLYRSLRRYPYQSPPPSPFSV